MKPSTSESIEQTFEIAATLAQKLPDRAVVGLNGELGAGKTTFVQGLAMGIGIPPETYITSPTFTILQVYPGEKKLLRHFDLYRLDQFQELLDIGFEELIDEAGITVIEWADAFDELTPYLTHRVALQILTPSSRIIDIQSSC